MQQMPKIRIHELAKELNIDNKKVMEYLKEKKIEVKSHMSTLEENQEAMVRKAFSSQPEKKEEREAPAEAPKKKSNTVFENIHGVVSNAQMINSERPTTF